MKLSTILRICIIAMFVCVILNIVFIKPKLGYVGLIRSAATISRICHRDILSDLTEYFKVNNRYPDSLSRMYEDRELSEHLREYISRTEYIANHDGSKYVINNTGSLEMDQVVLKRKDLGIMITLINLFILSLVVNLELINARNNLDANEKSFRVFANPVIVVSSIILAIIIFQELIIYANQ
jgi:hypothetical protein